MKPYNEVKKQIDSFQKKIELLKDLRTVEMKKQSSARNYNLLKWVWIELAVYNHTLNKFKWVLGANTDHHEEEE